MRIYDTFLTGVLAGHGLSMSWGHVASEAAVAARAITCNPTSDKQRSPGTQEVPL